MDDVFDDWDDSVDVQSECDADHMDNVDWFNVMAFLDDTDYEEDIYDLDAMTHEDDSDEMQQFRQQLKLPLMMRNEGRSQQPPQGLSRGPPHVESRVRPKRKPSTVKKKKASRVERSVHREKPERSEHFEKGVHYDWHFSFEFNMLVKDFHQKQCLQPSSSIKEAKKLHTECIRKLQKKMKELYPELYTDLIYTGSSYEGVKVKRTEDDDDLEFDIMVVMDQRNDVQVEPTERLNYVTIKLAKMSNAYNVFSRATTSDGDITAGKIVSTFQGQLTACIKSMQTDALREEENIKADAMNTPEFCHEMASNSNTDVTVNENVDQVKKDDNSAAAICLTEAEGNTKSDDLLKLFFKNMQLYIKLCRHGPAVQMDVTNPKTNKKFYSVDMVPTLKVSLATEGIGVVENLYVAKPFHRGDANETPVMAWRRSYSNEEKVKFSQMDQDNGCRKQVFRILKVIRNKEAGLASLSTYHLKTVLFREQDSLESDKTAWVMDRMGERLMGMFRRLRDELKAENIPHYFLRDVNLLEESSNSCKRSTTNRQMAERFSCLLNSEKKMMKILKS